MSSDRWDAASTYEDFMGRWSRRLATRFLAWLQIAPGAHWLDVGCGTGALTNAIASEAAPESVVGCDPAAPFIEFARAHANSSRVSFVVAGVGSLPQRPGGFDSVTSLLAFNFFPDPAAALRELRSVAAKHGTVSACVWDYAGRMEFLRYFWDAAVALDPAAEILDEGRRFPVCHPDVLSKLFRTGGLLDVRNEAIEIATTFNSFADYWQPFLGGTGPAPSYVASLPADGRERLAHSLEARLPRGADGSIALTARAWAVRGSVV